MSALEYGNSVADLAIPLSQFLRENPQNTHVATGAFIIHNDKLLIVQRSAEERGFGANLWEVPGGQVDAEDETILHGLAREVREEAGLVVKRVVRQLGNGTRFMTGKHNYKRWIKASFIVEVENDSSTEALAVRLDPKEHQAYYWISEKELIHGDSDDGKITFDITSPEQYALMRLAFTLRHQS